MIGTLIYVLLVVLIVGVVLWAINAMPWIDPPVRQAARVIVIAALAIWVIWIVFSFLAGTSLPYWPPPHHR